MHPSGRSLRLLAEIKERLLTTLPPTLTRSRRTPLIGPSAAGSGRAAPGERPGWDPVPRGAGKRPCAHRGADLRSSAAGERRTSGGVSRFLPPEALRAPAEGPNLWVQRPDSEPGGRSLLLPHPRPSRNEGGKTTSAAERFSPVPSRPPPLPDLNEYEAPLRENAFFFSFFSFLFKISTADRFSFRNQTSNKYYLATFFFSFLFFFFLFFLFLFYKNKRTIKSLQWGGDKKSVTAGPSPGLGTATRTQRALRTSNVVRGGGDANRVTRFKNREKSKKPTPTEAHRSGPRGARRPRGCDTAQRSDGARRGVYVQSPKDTKPTGRDRSGSGGGGVRAGVGTVPCGRGRTDGRADGPPKSSASGSSGPPAAFTPRPERRESRRRRRRETRGRPRAAPPGRPRRRGAP